MPQSEFESCIQACYACAEACDMCATACLQEPDPKSMARCIALDNECAAICRMSAMFMSRSSEHARQLCGLCADICDACGEECARHLMQHCQDCAAMCRRCADECRRMSQSAGTSGSRQTSLSGTH